MRPLECGLWTLRQALAGIAACFPVYRTYVDRRVSAQDRRYIDWAVSVARKRNLDADAKELSKKLLSKEAATNSGAWTILSSANPEALLYLAVTGRNKTVDEKIKNFLGEWRQLQEKIPVAQMAELRITPQLPEYARICQEAIREVWVRLV